MSSGRMYTAQFAGVTVSAQQDLFEITAPPNAVVILHQVVISQSSETGDAQEEGLVLHIKRGADTPGSGGAAATPSPLQAGFGAAGTSVAVNNTGKAAGASVETLHSEAWNVRAPWIWLPPPEGRIVLSPDMVATVELATTPNDAITACGTVVFEEIGG